MRKYWAAFTVLAVCGAPAAASDLPTKKPAPEPVVTPTLPSSWHFEITGYGWGTDLAGQSGVGPFPTSPFYVNFLKLLEHFQGGLMTAFVARNDTFVAGLDVILSHESGARDEFRRDPTSALFNGDHANLTLTEADRNRLRWSANTDWTAEPRALRHTRSSLFPHPHCARLVVSGRRLRARVHTDEGLGRSGRRARRALRHQRQMVHQFPDGSGRPDADRGQGDRGIHGCEREARASPSGESVGPMPGNSDAHIVLIVNALVAPVPQREAD